MPECTCGCRDVTGVIVITDAADGYTNGGMRSGKYVIPEESELADALIEITQRYGKFNSDDTGVWAGYTPGVQNELASIGVKCSNCILYEGGTSCKIIEAQVEPDGYCRFALIPDGVVTAAASKPAPKKIAYVDQMQTKKDLHLAVKK